MAIENKNWFRRHWILSIIFVFVILGIIGIVFDTDDNSNLTGNVVNEQQSQEEITSQVISTNPSIEDLFFNLDELGLEYDKELGYGWYHESNIERWDILGSSGFKKILYKDYRYVDKRELKSTSKWLEITIWEAYSLDTTIEYTKNWKKTNALDKPDMVSAGLYNYTQYDLDLEDYSFGESYYFFDYVSTVWVVKDNLIINVMYHSTEEDTKEQALYYIENILNKFN